MTLPANTTDNAAVSDSPRRPPSPVTPVAVSPHAQPNDPIEQVVHLVPIVLPIVGGVLMFLLAFIAVYMA